MKREYYENALDYWNLSNGIYSVKMKEDDGLDDISNNKNVFPSHMGAFILSIYKRIMNNFVGKIDGFSTNKYLLSSYRFPIY